MDKYCVTVTQRGTVPRDSVEEVEKVNWVTSFTK